MKHALVGTVLLFAGALASPALIIKNLVKRDPSLINNLPSDNKDCNGNDYKPDEIRTAVGFGWQAFQDGKQYKYDKGKASYPHRNTPTQVGMQWTDFNLEGCAQENSDDDTKSKFQQYPIIPGGSAWQGGNVKQGNDRVIFQVIDDSTAAFCGIVTHTTNDIGRPTGKFRLCDDPEGTVGKPPYAPGTCSLHLTQWDYSLGPDVVRSPQYDVEVHIFDNNKVEIGTLDRTPADNDHPAFINSALEDDLIVTPESENDYIAFSLPNQNWPSNGQFGPGDTPNSCSVGDYDGSDFPAYRQMDCSFVCGWGGGESSANAESDDG